MQSGLSIEQALRRLEGALDLLEGVVEGRVSTDGKLEEMEDELQRVNLDRSRLAQSLDMAQARSDRMSDIHQDVSRRLVGAMETIRGILEKNGA